MTKYRIDVCASFMNSYEIEAQSEDEACDIVSDIVWKDGITIAPKTLNDIEICDIEEVE